jgi:hypothetical protein
MGRAGGPEKDDLGLGAMAIMGYSTIGGTAVGAEIGALIRTEMWQELSLPGVT